MRLAAAALAAALLAGVAAAQTPPAAGVSGDPACAPSATDRAWMSAAPQAWATIERDFLKLSPPAKPAPLVLFDAVCVYRSTDGARWASAQHHGDIETPRGDHEKPVNISYSAMANGEPFMVMALPSVWSAIMHRDHVDTFLIGVFVHEMTHTRQLPGYRARQRAAAQALGHGVGSDTVQQAFGKDAAFAASIAEEEQVLAAGLKGDDAALRKAAAKALALMRARRDHWFIGANAPYGALEDVFLALEGGGNLAGYAWLVRSNGGGMTPDAAFAQLNDAGDWSHSEGFLVMLAVQRLVPDWPEHAFGPDAEAALQLLARAAGET